MGSTANQSVCSVTDQKDQVAETLLKFAKNIFSSQANEAFFFMKELVNKLYKHRSHFPLAKFYFGNMGRTRS